MCALPFYRQGDHQEDGRPFQKPFQGPVNLPKHRWGYSSSDHPRGPGGTTAAGGAAGVMEKGRARTAVAGPPVRLSGALAELQDGVDQLLPALDAAGEVPVDRLGGGDEGILVGLVHLDAAFLQRSEARVVGKECVY